MNPAKIEEALKTMERARDDAIVDLAGGNTSFVKQLEEAVKAILILRQLQQESN